METENAKRLRGFADILTKQIEAKRHPRIAQQNITPRRATISENIYQEADRLENIQNKLRGLADAFEFGIVPDSLKGITTKARQD